jgi:protein involved in polysaccharide export with SLBB domain
MTSKALLFLLLPCTLCAGQSVLTTPAESTQSAPGSSAGQGPSTGATQGLSQAPRQTGDKTYLNTITPTLTVPALAQTPASSRIVGPLTQKSDFEQFAEDATGRRLPVYGRRLFDEVPTTFAPVEQIPVPVDYVLGPGDELLIRAWGKIDLDSRVTVDRNGQITLPKVGALTVAGLHSDQVERYLHSAISALYKDFELNVALGQLRSIQIFVLGSARQPGEYTISSLSTLVDALFASGGPSATGTMRHIQLRRGGQTLTEFDLYDLIQKGDKSHDVRLLPGDVIYYSPIGAQVAISGDINEPGIYELKGETTVGAALIGAGGVTSLADTERVVLERIENHSSREVEEFALDASGQGRLLRDGDLLRVFPLSPKFMNAVTLRGNVAQPGLYPWKEGMRISDLIPSRGFLVTRDYWNLENHLVPRISAHPFGNPQANQFRDQQKGQSGDPSAGQYGNPRTGQYGNAQADQYGNAQADQYGYAQADQYGYAQADQYGYAQADQYGNAQAGQSGSLRTNQPGNQSNNPTGNLRTPIIDTVGKTSAEINWEYALIERLDERDLSTRLIPFNLAGAIGNPASSDNPYLKAGDVVTIFSRTDLELPMDKHALFVRVSGEVNAPGVYRVNPGGTLRDVVEQAGGLTPHSYLYASIFTRVSARQAQEKQLQQSAEQMQRELSSKFANATPQAGQTGADQQAQLAMQQSALARLTSIKPTGRVVLNMKPMFATIADIPDFTLEDGDTFYIPPQLSTVQVAGAVYNTNAFRYEQGKRLIAYLNDAGGATREADQKRIFVIRADGKVVSRQSRRSHTHSSYENLVLLPGDAIVVPEKMRVSSAMSDFLQFSQFASQLALTAAALSVVK